MATREETVADISDEEKKLLMLMARSHLFFLDPISQQDLKHFKGLLERHIAAVSERMNAWDAAWEVLKPVWEKTMRDRCNCPSCENRRKEWLSAGCKCYICELSNRMQAPIMKSFG